MSLELSDLGGQGWDAAGICWSTHITAGSIRQKHQMSWDETPKASFSILQHLTFVLKKNCINIKISKKWVSLSSPPEQKPSHYSKSWDQARKANAICTGCILWETSTACEASKVCNTCEASALNENTKTAINFFFSWSEVFLIKFYNRTCKWRMTMVWAKSVHIILLHPVKT